jgi:hypothetical protein
MRNTYKILIGKLEGKRSLRRPRREWEDSIKTDVREMGWEYVDWMNLAQDLDHRQALVNTVMNFRVP